jgi:ATP-dependent helicase HrpA
LYRYGAVEREEQDAALALDPSRCKVVLSTNIAESSVTLPDVTHVIDAGLCNYVVGGLYTS